MSRDHKPDDEVERHRIISSGGRVQSYLNEYGEPVGPARVWLKNQNVPGLAIARTFGDAVAASVGVTFVPGNERSYIIHSATRSFTIEIKEFEIDDDHKSRFIVIASDGVWEFLTNNQVSTKCLLSGFLIAFIQPYRSLILSSQLLSQMNCKYPAKRSSRKPPNNGCT